MPRSLVIRCVIIVLPKATKNVPTFSAYAPQSAVLPSPVPIPYSYLFQTHHPQSKNPISSSRMPLSPLCGPLLTGGHSSALCLSFSASERACGSSASLPCTTYSCSASASASSTWWLSSRVSLGTTMMGTPVRRASRIEPEPVARVLVKTMPIIFEDRGTSEAFPYQHVKSPLPPSHPCRPWPGAYVCPGQLCRDQSRRLLVSTSPGRSICTFRITACHLGRTARSARCSLGIRARSGRRARRWLR